MLEWRGGGDALARRGTRGDGGALLRRVLGEPGLVAAVQQLEPRALGTWVERVGLEDAGELVALATTEQILHLFDESLWTSERPGDDEHFDSARFATWLEVLLEAGEEVAARRLAELPEDLLALALHAQMLVLDLDALALDLAREGPDASALAEKVLEASLTCELDRWLLVSRRHEGWDALVAVLGVLDRDHHDVLDALLERCCRATAAHVDDEGGLHAALTAAETLEADAAADRVDRRTREGYVAPADARAFLELARTSDPGAILAESGPDPVTRAVFRERESRPVRGADAPPASAAAPAPDRASAGRLLAALQEAELLPEAPALLAAPGAGPDPFRAALLRLEERDPAVHARRMEELAYLANVLVAGDRRGERAWRPVEAVQEVVAICTTGLEHALGGAAAPDAAADALARHGADRLFRLGWRLRGR